MAKYGKFESYEPATDVASDAFRFQLENGNPILLAGQPALDLKSRLDAYDQAQPKLAEAPAQPQPGVTPVKSDATTTETIKVNAPGRTQAIVDQATQPQDRPVVLNEVNTGVMLDEQGRPYVVEGPTAATPGGVVPTAQSESVTGGFERDADYQEALSAARINEQLAVKRQRDAELVADAEGRKVAQEQFAAAAGQMDEQQKIIAGIQAQVQQAQAVRDMALADYTSSEVEPNRIFQGGARPLLGILAAVAAGAGAYGAAINKTENFAMKAIDQAINRDIAAQEAQIRIKKDAAGNALQDLMQRGMSLEQAKGTLATIQKTWAAQQLQLARGASSSEVINARYDAAIGKMQADAIKEAEDYDIKSQGTATKTIQAKVVQARAGSPGGRRYLSPKEAIAFSKEKTGTEGGIASTAGATATAKKTEAEAEKAALEGGPGGKKPLANEQKKAIADLDAAIAGIDEYEKMDSKDKVLLGTTGTFADKHRKQMGAIANALAPGLARAVEGDAATRDSMDRATGGLTALTYDQRQVTRDEYRKQLIRKRQAILDGQK